MNDPVNASSNSVYARSSGMRPPHPFGRLRCSGKRGRAKYQQREYRFTPFHRVPSWSSRACASTGIGGRTAESTPA